MRNSSADRTWIVIDCKWMCVEGGLCVILSFERFKKFPTHSRFHWSSCSSENEDENNEMIVFVQR